MVNNPYINKNHIISCFENGLNGEIVAYHGTSIEVIEEIIKQGIQPGNPIIERKYAAIRKGDIFVYPIKGRTRMSGSKGIYDEKTALENASAAAENISIRTFFQKELKLPLIPEIENHPNIEKRLDWVGLTTPILGCMEGIVETITYLKQRGFKEKQIKELIEKAENRKGIIIGYKNSIFKKGRPLPGDDLYDVRVKNITIEDIVGIEPLDQESWNFFNNL